MLGIPGLQHNSNPGGEEFAGRAFAGRAFKAANVRGELCLQQLLVNPPKWTFHLNGFLIQTDATQGLAMSANWFAAYFL